MPADPARSLAALWHLEAARVIGRVTRIVRDVGLAEDIAQDVLLTALERWPADGMPANPAAWLMTAASHRALDHLRHAAMAAGKEGAIGHDMDFHHQTAAEEAAERAQAEEQTHAGYKESAFYGWATSGDGTRSRDELRALDLLASLRLCSNVTAQWAIKPALEGPNEIGTLTREGGRLHAARAAVRAAVERSEFLDMVAPMGALYAFPQVDVARLPGFDDAAFALDLLENERVLLVPGSSFNIPARNHFRITLLPEPGVLDDAFAAIERELERHAQHANPLCRPSRNADLIHGTTYQLPRIRNNHDLVGFADREAGDEFTILRQTVGDESLPASSRTAIVKR